MSLCKSRFSVHLLKSNNTLISFFQGCRNLRIYNRITVIQKENIINKLVFIHIGGGGNLSFFSHNRYKKNSKYMNMYGDKHSYTCIYIKMHVYLKSI